jgi:ring-1,2-phenylacetyl-CoA epoxidase subunit PaaE
VATATRSRHAFRKLKVADVQRLTDDAAAITFDVPVDLQQEYAFRPGQSLTLRKYIGDHEERRSYSICAPAGDKPRVGVREVPDGLFSTWLVHEVRPGEEIEVLPPTGTFTTDVDVPAHHVFIAAGSGITPVLSLVGPSASRRHSDLVLRKPAQRHRDVRRRVGRPEGPIRTAAGTRPRAVARTA